jgi:hypothetical protein
MKEFNSRRGLPTPSESKAPNLKKNRNLFYFFVLLLPDPDTYRSLETESKTLAFDLVSICSTRTDLSRTGDLGVHEPHLQLGDHVVPQLRQSTRIRQEPNIFTFLVPVAVYQNRERAL